jgi:hypothetical protein
LRQAFVQYRGEFSEAWAMRGTAVKCSTTIVVAVAIFVSTGLAGANVPAGIPPGQIAIASAQGNWLAPRIRQAIDLSEAAAKGQKLTSDQIKMNDVSGIQEVLILSGFDPRVVMLTLQAVADCAANPSQSRDGPISCAGLTEPLPKEALEALLDVQKTIAALLSGPLPTSIVGGGPAAFGTPPCCLDGGGNNGTSSYRF